MNHYSDYYSHEDLMSDMDDRDDSNDPEFRDPAGYCEHGKYVGGCGIDWMCGWCEDGVSAAEAERISRDSRTHATRVAAERAADVLNTLLSHHGTVIGGIDAAHLAQESSYTLNPASRYGRH